MTTATTPEAGLLDRIRALDTCALSDALDTLGLAGATTGIRALWPVTRSIVGRVRTIQAGPRRADAPGAHIAAAAVDDAESGEVLVIANDGRVDVSCWGGILALAASRRRIAGVVIDGACRDIDESRDLDVPVFGRAVVPVSARGRIVQLAMDETIEVAGVSVSSQDWVVADANGVVFVPSARAAEVVALAERIAEREAGMAEAVRRGDPVDKVMHDSRFPTAADLDSGDGSRR